MTRRTMAERKRRAAERDIRRESLLVLLSRMQRGALLDNERPLLRAHVETALGEAAELRRTVAGQQTAIQAAHDRTAAAEAAIREMEQRAVDAEEQLRAYRAVEIEADRDRAEATLQRVRDADSLGAALAAVAEHDGLTPNAAHQFAAIAEAAESPRALLHEQARAHAIKLAEWKRRFANQGETIRDMGRANWEASTRAHAAEERAEAATRIGVRHMATAERYEAAWHSARRGRAAAEAALAAELPNVIAGQQARAADPDRAQLARP
ncbi:hypothetical protein ACFV2U_21205 [Streptomyces sp. NPDC059697]|uniref:hypothetical protein n=1 Tax=Streptomyces sp. NPDC059697 TaxID=3346912 RepID=UPI0036CCBD89